MRLLIVLFVIALFIVIIAKSWFIVKWIIAIILLLGAIDFMTNKDNPAPPKV